MTELVRKETAPILGSRSLVPRSLARKNKLSLIDKAWVYYDSLIFFPALITCLGSMYVLIASQDWTWVGWLMVASFIVGFPYFIVICNRLNGSNVQFYPDRKNQALWDYSRKRAMHRRDRRGRYTDVKYDQFSVWVERQADEIVLCVLKHEMPVGFPRKLRGNQHWFKWEASRTQKGYAGEYASVANVRLTTPTFDSLQEKITKLDESARELERQSYLEGVRRAELDKMAFAARKPEGPARHVKVIKSEDSERVLEHAIARDYQPSE